MMNPMAMLPQQANPKMQALADLKAKMAKKRPKKKKAVKHTAAHPGFQALVRKGVPPGALANAARNASPAAKRANPRLARVKG